MTCQRCDTETLRRAAALMRERAEAASLPPGIKGGAARHVASWSPAVALAVADWLDNVARHADYFHQPNDRGWSDAVAVANTYLGQ